MDPLDSTNSGTFGYTASIADQPSTDPVTAAALEHLRDYGDYVAKCQCFMVKKNHSPEEVSNLLCKLENSSQANIKTVMVLRPLQWTEGQKIHFFEVMQRFSSLKELQFFTPLQDDALEASKSFAKAREDVEFHNYIAKFC